MNKKLSTTFLVFLGIIFILNLIQAHFTELIFDEAYYWYYAQNMAWGYFDHPPMVAFLIKLSSFIFNGELGVRFMSCVLSVGTFSVLWFMIDHPKKKEYIPHFFVLVFSMTLVHAYGFLTLPDTPLLFFTALFLLVYKQFIKNPTLFTALAMGIVMAALMYSKYHAVLVIVFVLISNISLLKNKYAWLAVFISLVCYTPHFIWLFENDFVSIKYHLFERPNRAYEFGDFTAMFFLNLIAIFGFTFPWIYWSLYKTKSTDKFIKALLYLTYGVLIFFFLSSFNRRVQTQWIIVVSIPIALIVFNFMLKNETAKKWIYRMGLINLALFLFVRIGLIHQSILPFNFVYETHYNKKWVNDIKSQIGDTPVVFENSYRLSPMYAFYSGNNTFSMNNTFYRKNQYSIDKSEQKVQGQRVLYVSQYTKNGDVSYTNPKGVVHYGRYIDNFESYRKLKCILDVDGRTFTYTEGEKMGLKIYNPYQENVDLKKLKFAAIYLNSYKQMKESVSIVPESKENSNMLQAKDTTYFSFVLPKPPIEDFGHFKVAISENGYYLGLNGEPLKVTE